MQKLSGIDATFLYMETPETPMHVSSVMMLEPVAKGDNPYESMKSQIAARLHEIPAFHRKLMPTPFHIDHPVWVQADKVDMDYHVKHAHLPKPGNLEQLRHIVQGLHSLPLDRDRPLWQFYIIEGVEDPDFNLPKGSFAIYTKAHHSSIDGGAGVNVMDILSDQERTPRKPLPKSEIALTTEKPGFYELLGSAYGKFAQYQVDTLKATPKYIKAFGNVMKNAAENREHLFKDNRPAPKTRFNVRIQKQRSFGASTLSIKDTIAIAKQTKTTLNDVVLAVCGGALRRYLIRHDELPKRSLVAAVPVSLREVGDKSQSNQVASINCAIGTHITDPLERLREVNANSKRSKAQLAAIKEVIPRDYSFFGAPVLVTAMAQMMGKSTLMDHAPSPINLAISNVPGPRKHVFFAGSKVRAIFPVSIVTHGCAVNITLQGYVDRLEFGVIGCKVAVPDVQDIADDIVAEFKLLQKAVKAAQ